MLFFFLGLASSDRPKFLAFSKKKKIYHFQVPISFEVILLIWKMSIVTAKTKTGTRTGTFFTVYCVSVVYPNMWMLTFNVVLGYQGILFQDFLWIFFRCFFFLIRPTQYQETHSTLNETNKDGLKKKEKERKERHFNNREQELQRPDERWSVKMKKCG